MSTLCFKARIWDDWVRVPAYIAPSPHETLRYALTSNDDRLLKGIINIISVPPQYRSPGSLSANSVAELELLVREIGFSNSPAFQRLLELYRESPPGGYVTRD